MTDPTGDLGIDRLTAAFMLFGPPLLLIAIVVIIAWLLIREPSARPQLRFWHWLIGLFAILAICLRAGCSS